MINLLVPPEFITDNGAEDATLSSSRAKMPKETISQAHLMKRNLQRKVQTELFMKLSEDKTQTKIGVADWIDFKNKMTGTTALEVAENICKTEFQKRDVELTKIKSLKSRMESEGSVCSELKISKNKQIKRKVDEHFDYLLKKTGNKEYLFELFAPELVDHSKKFEERNAKYPKTHERINKMSIHEFRKHRNKILHSVTKNPETSKRIGKEKRSHSFDVKIDLHAYPAPLIDPEIFLEKKKDPFASQHTSRPQMNTIANLKTIEEHQNSESSFLSPFSKREGERKSSLPMIVINDSVLKFDTPNANEDSANPTLKQSECGTPVPIISSPVPSGKTPDLLEITKDLILPVVAEVDCKDSSRDPGILRVTNLQADNQKQLPILKTGSQPQSPNKTPMRPRPIQNNHNLKLFDRKELNLPSLSPSAMARSSFKTPQKTRPRCSNRIRLSPLHGLSPIARTVDTSTIESSGSRRYTKEDYRDKLMRNRVTERIHIQETIRKIQADHEETIEKLKIESKLPSTVQSKGKLTSNISRRFNRKGSTPDGRNSILFEDASSNKVRDRAKLGMLLGKLNTVRDQMQNIFEEAEMEKWKNDLVLENLDETRDLLSDLNFEGKILQIIYFYRKMSQLTEKEEADKIVEQFRTGEKLPHHLAEETRRQQLLQLTKKIHNEYEKIVKMNWGVEEV